MKSISKRGEKQSIKRLENVKKLMRVISKLDDDDFKALSKHLSRDAYDMIFQSVWNSLYNSDISQEKRDKLKETLWNDKDKFIELARKKTDFKEKRKLVNQIGGGFPFIASIVLPLIIELITKAVKSKSEK
jgi:hypothetical protein